MNREVACGVNLDEHFDETQPPIHVTLPDEKLAALGRGIRDGDNGNKLPTVHADNKRGMSLTDDTELVDFDNWQISQWCCPDDLPREDDRTWPVTSRELSQGDEEMLTQDARTRPGGMVVVLATALCASTLALANDADRIRPYAENPYYWQYKGDPVLLLGGSWQDNLFNHPIGLEKHLDLLVSVGGNYVRNTMSHRNQGNVFAYIQRAGPGIPLEEDGKFDLDTFHEDYWLRLDDFLRMTHQRDIIVQIEIFDPHDHFRDHQSLGGWSKHPFNPANNVNYTAEESGLPTSANYRPVATPSEHPFWLAVPALQNNQLVLRYQQAYVDKLLSITLAYPHVLYSIQNRQSLWPRCRAQYRGRHREGSGGAILKKCVRRRRLDAVPPSCPG